MSDNTAAPAASPEPSSWAAGNPLLYGILDLGYVREADAERGLLQGER